MKNNNLYNDSLYTFFCSNNPSNILFLLKEFDGINVLYENGFFFTCAISQQNKDICSTLLNYFENKQFPIKNTEYQEAKDKLIEILENATDSIDLSPEIKEVLAPYIDFEGSEHNTLNDSFLDDYQVTFPENLNKTNSNTGNPNILNEGILRRFNAETEKISQKQIIEDVLGFNSHDITDNHQDTTLSGEGVNHNESHTSQDLII